MRTIIRDNYTPHLGDYHEMIVIDEAQEKRWLFDCDGVFMPFDGEKVNVVSEFGDSTEDAISQKFFTDTANGLQDEIDEIKNNPDVVDIVDTYADLQSYDTSKLGDRDIVRVLTDETHDGESSYYRWDKPNNQWVFIGAVEGYYTKDQTDELIENAPAFKPFPDSVVTDGTTQQFFNSILALQPEVGMAYLGTVELSDMPAGLIQEEVEVYVYNDYVVYGVMRSTDVEPYQWWAASYNYGGWRPIGGASNTIFYANLNETGTTRHIYKNADMTGTVSVQDILDANLAGQVILRMSTAQYPSEYNDAYLQNTYIGVNDYQFLFLDNRVYYEYDASATSDTSYYYSTSTIQLQLSAGSNITINGNTISATDTTYSNFVGTDGVDPGVAGLVPAPATTDAGKFLKADGTWGTAGSPINVVQTTGTSQTDVMSQNATTSMVYRNPTSNSSSIIIGKNPTAQASDTNNNILIGNDGVLVGSGSNGTNSVLIGKSVNSTAPSGAVKGAGNGNIAIGLNSGVFHTGSNLNELGQISIGREAKTVDRYSIAIGDSTEAKNGGVAIGSGAKSSINGQFSINAASGSGYNNSNYRLISGVYDGQSAHDAATKGQLDSISIQNAGAPTTATVGSVGQLLQDTTNGDLYICTAVDTTDPQNPAYTWEEVGGGGGAVRELTSADYNLPVGNPTYVAAWLLPTGMYYWENGTLIYVSSAKTTQNAGSMVVLHGGGTATVIVNQYNNLGAKYICVVNESTGYETTDPRGIVRGEDIYSLNGATIKAIKIGGNASGTNSTAVGLSAQATANNTTCLGSSSSAPQAGSTAIGVSSNAAGKYSVAFTGGTTSTQGVFQIGLNASGWTGVGYNNSDYRLLTGLYDGQSNHDAATVAQGNKLMTAAPTATDAGVLGQLWTDTTNIHTYQLTAIDTTDPDNPVYTWTQRW